MSSSVSVHQVIVITSSEGGLTRTRHAYNVEQIVPKASTLCVLALKSRVINSLLAPANSPLKLLNRR
jgi:hypothetical protein